MTCDRLQNEHPIVKKILQFKRIDQAGKTWLRHPDEETGEGGLEAQLWADGKLHSHYSPLTSTGRYRSSEPNVCDIISILDVVKPIELLERSLTQSAAKPAKAGRFRDYRKAPYGEPSRVGLKRGRSGGVPRGIRYSPTLLATGELRSEQTT